MPIQHYYSQTVADGTATSVVRPSDWNSNHKMVYNLSGNTAGSSQVTGADVVFQGGNNITLSADTANSRIVFNGAVPTPLSFYEPTPLIGTSLSSFGQNSLYFVPVKPVQDVTMTVVNILASINNATSAISHAVSQTISYGWYSLGSGTNNTRIESMATSSLAVIVSASSNANWGATLSQGTNSTTYASAGTGSTSAWTGQRVFQLPMGTLLAEGVEYYFGYANSTNSVGNTGAFRMSNIVLNNMTNGSFGRMGPTGQTVSNASIVPNFAGFVYTATSAAWPSTIALSQRSIVSNIRNYIQLDA